MSIMLGEAIDERLVFLELVVKVLDFLLVLFNGDPVFLL